MCQRAAAQLLQGRKRHLSYLRGWRQVPTWLAAAYNGECTLLISILAFLHCLLGQLHSLAISLSSFARASVLLFLSETFGIWVIPPRKQWTLGNSTDETFLVGVSSDES